MRGRLRWRGVSTLVVAAMFLGTVAVSSSSAETPESRDDYSQFSPGLRALLEDVRSGRLNEEAFVNHGYAKLGWQGNPPARYRDESITEQERAVLALAMDSVLASLPHSVRNGIRNRVTNHAFDEGIPREQVRPVPQGWAATREGMLATQRGEVGTQAVPPAQCGGTPLRVALIGTFKCLHVTPNFRIWYNLDGPRPVNGDDGPVNNWREGIPDDGIPNYIQRAAVSLEIALDTYTALGYRRPNSDQMLVLFGPGGAGAQDGFTPPTDIIGRSAIFLGNTADEWSTVRHEVFHVIQYAYKPPRSTANIPGNLIPLQSWMESTAEWATHHAVKDDPYMPQALRYKYARNIVDFLGRPNESITHWDGFAKGRQYGGFIFAEFLEERFGTDVIRRIWEHIHASRNADPGIMISDVVGELGSSIINEMIEYGIASYQLCGQAMGGPPFGSVWHMQDPDIPAWCNILDNDPRTSKGDPFPRFPRPAREVRQLTGDGKASGDISLEEGGSAYVDIAVPGATSAGAWKTWAVDVMAAVQKQVGSIQVTSILWSDFPARAVPDRGSTPIPDFHETFRMGPCASQVQALTLVFTHFRADLVDYREPNAKIHWETTFAGVESAGISNGTVTLGVNKLGTLHEQGCSPSSGEHTTAVGLRYLPTNGEGLAHVDQNGECKCEGWGLYVSHPGGVPPYFGWARGPWEAGSSIPATSVTPVSFESTETTARSVVRIESGYGSATLEQVFSPSPVKELYQVSVTIRTTGDELSVPYVRLRRVLNWNADPTPRQEYVTVRAQDPQVEYSSDDGLAAADPTGGRTKIREDGEFTDAGPYDQGALFDFAVPVAHSPIEGNIARITLFYGAAPDQPAAYAAFNQLGIRTWSIAKPVTSGHPGTPNTFMFGFKP